MRRLSTATLMWLAGCGMCLSVGIVFGGTVGLRAARVVPCLCDARAEGLMVDGDIELVGDFPPTRRAPRARVVLPARPFGAGVVQMPPADSPCVTTSDFLSRYADPPVFESGPLPAGVLAADVTPVPTPEPASVLLLGSGVVGVVALARRRRR
jgi:hypothetical protein